MSEGTASRMMAKAMTDMSHKAVLHMQASKATWVCDYDPLFQQSTTELVLAAYTAMET